MRLVSESESEEQRRSAVRQRVAVVPRLAQVLYSNVARRPVRMAVLDVSGTGLQVRSHDELRAGDLLELAFRLDVEVHVHARVRRVRRGERVWDAGCAFEGVPEWLSDQIVHSIFALQRQTLRARRNAR
jgi:c-di-GMP-binding flagellar brake protein YcgR